VILAGQSWGGNVVLEAAARYPELAVGLIFVDGGFLDLKARGKWEDIERELRPPTIAGMPKQEIVERIGAMHPGWIPDGVEMTLGNFEILQDETVRPWLNLNNHMAILRALYDQDVKTLYPSVKQHTVICAADDGTDWTSRKKVQVEQAQRLLRSSEVHWFSGAAHDIHVDKPEELTEQLLRSVDRFA
jgi:pimeloyl-ACP methyl ester carboxylesterase